MKLIKMSLFALTMGIFATSCGNSSNAAKSTADSAAAAPAPTAAPAPAPEAPKDTVNAGPANAPATAAPATK